MLPQFTNGNHVTAATDNHESEHVQLFTRRQLRRIEWNARVMDRLPRMLASGWYFTLRCEAETNP